MGWRLSVIKIHGMLIPYTDYLNSIIKLPQKLLSIPDFQTQDIQSTFKKI